MSNVYLSSSDYKASTQNTYSNIGYGGSNLNLPLTINSTAGIIFCNNGGTQLGNSCSISSNGVFNCMGLVLGGPLTCASLIVPSSGSITCLGSFNCSGVLNMNTNNISGVANLTCTSLTCNSNMSISGVNVTAAGVITGVTSLTCNGPINGTITLLTCSLSSVLTITTNVGSTDMNIKANNYIRFAKNGNITGVDGLNNITFGGANKTEISGVAGLNGLTLIGSEISGVTNLNGLTLNVTTISGVTNLNGLTLNGTTISGVTNLNGMTLNGFNISGITELTTTGNVTLNSVMDNATTTTITCSTWNTNPLNNIGKMSLGSFSGTYLASLHIVKKISTTIVAGSASYFNSTNRVLANGATLSRNVSIFAAGSILTSEFAIAASSTAYSDNRIKTNIIDIDDVSAMATLRLIEPKRYNYIDVITRGSEPVWGFIAQQVRSVLPYSTSLMKKEIPNVYDIGSVASDMITITLSSKSTSLFQRDVSGNLFSICLMDNDNIEIKTTITAIIDDKTFTIADNLTDKQIGTLSKIFVYGSIVDDFHILDKAAIFTIAAAALQELDREYQVTKLEVVNLTLQNASRGVKITALTSQNALMSSQIATLIAQVNLLIG